MAESQDAVWPYPEAPDPDGPPHNGVEVDLEYGSVGLDEGSHDRAGLARGQEEHVKALLVHSGDYAPFGQPQPRG